MSLELEVLEVLEDTKVISNRNVLNCVLYVLNVLIILISLVCDMNLHVQFIQ